MMRPVGASYEVMRRVAGRHNHRLDGVLDIEVRAKGRSVFDIGCNRGMVCYRMAESGAKLVHGCDIDRVAIETARHVFADVRAVESRFEVVDLTGGPNALGVFNSHGYDIVLCLATYHKLKRVMTPPQLSELMQFFGTWTKKYFVWRGTSDKPSENENEIIALDATLKRSGLYRVHTSYLSSELGAAAIWQRP